MGVFSTLRRRRYEKKAAYKAAKVQAKTTAKAQAKLDKNAEKYLRKTTGKIRKVEAKDAKAQRKQDGKLAAALVSQAKNRGPSAKKALGLLGVARVIVPVALPLIYRGLNQLNRVPGGQGLARTGGGSAFTGKDAVLRARIADLRNRLSGTGVPEDFRSDASGRLGKLESALDRAGSGDIPGSLLSSVSTELDTIDEELDAALR
jgi:hypothetical protein